jgi:ketosteroid isomerase-like protein
VFVGREGVRAYMTSFLDAWDSLTIAAESVEGTGDSVFVKVRQSGIGRGSGVPVETAYFQLWTFRGSRVIRLESILSEKEALEAVGLSEQHRSRLL